MTAFQVRLVWLETISQKIREFIELGGDPSSEDSAFLAVLAFRAAADLVMTSPDKIRCEGRRDSLRPFLIGGLDVPPVWLLVQRPHNPTTPFSIEFVLQRADGLPDYLSQFGTWRLPRFPETSKRKRSAMT
jgi:hypothetical protein